ncbi:MAG: nitroreductase [Bacteroidales bacterium]|nr:nitroreductase [Bacteroidales bacterium]
MEIIDVIKQRHSVRSFKEKPIEQEKINTLQAEVANCNKESGLNIQLITEDKDAFNTMLAHYGKFTNAVNYFAIVGKKSEDLDIKGGYYGERLVLLSQQLGLNTCWVGLTFSKKKNKIVVNTGEKLLCVIALGYGESQGVSHKIKTFEQVTENISNPPEWFRNGVEAALLAPTSLNQQKFKFGLKDNKVTLQRIWGPYTKTDLGIVKYHFEIIAGKDNFTWA